MNSFSIIVVGLIFLCITGEEAKARSSKGYNCDNPVVKSPDENLKKFGITGGRDGACPLQSEIDKNKSCLKNANRIHAAYDKWKKAYDNVCAELNKTAPEAIKTCTTGSAACFNGQDKSLNALNDAIKIEREAAESAKTEMKNVRENSTIEVAGKLPGDLYEAATGAPGDCGTTACPDFNNRTNSEITAVNKGETMDSASAAIDAIRSMNNAALNQVKSPYLKEPLGVAAAATEFEKQLTARSTQITQVSRELASQSNTSATNSRNMGSIGSGTKDAAGAVTGENGSSPGLQNASDMAGAASGLAGGMGGAAGSGSGAYSAASFPTDSAKVNVLDKTKSTLDASAAPTDPTKIKIVKPDLSKAVASAADANGSTGASKAPTGSAANALGDRLRAKLQSGEGVVGESSSGPRAPSPLAKGRKQSGSGAKDPGDEFAPFSPMGGNANNGFAMAASETDSAVKNMMNDFQSRNERERSPASEAAEQESILGSETASLFERTRETHHRCLLRGLVTSRRI